ncbi:MAG TPA: glutamate-5-semialdehyde dehydrogenase, partial [Leeuwenhoekiella sp.]|nr:glutamate-5-semialdehyde dehydrogenase [Leeuwenhoekiella sp.]
MQLLNTDIKNKVLDSMMQIIESRKDEILEANKKDLEAFNRDDQALYDRLVV